MARHNTIVLCVLYMLFSGVGSVSAVVQYTVTDLGTLPGYLGSRASAINASGQVAGYAYKYSDNQEHAFLYTNGIMVDLGTLPGDSWSIATGINDNGMVVGYSGNGNFGYGPTHAFLYCNETMSSLGTFGGSSSVATSINASGQVAGYTFTSKYSDEYAFIYTNGTITDLGLGAALAINASGQVVGSANTFHGAGPAFLYSNGTKISLTPFGISNNEAYGINTSGQVVGWFDAGSYEPHAFLYNNGTTTNLHTLGGQYSSADGINDSGKVVGWSKTASDYDHAFLYSDGSMKDLNSLIDPASGWTLYEATAINNSGWIVGTGHNSITYNYNAFLLTPVPEPSTFILLGFATISLLAYAWRQQRA